MWIKYDSAYHVLRIGIVSGTSATVPNIFPVLDLNTMTWSFDTLGQELSCITEVEAGSGSVTVIQAGGGTDDGTVYLLNNTDNDVTTPIDSYVTMEFDAAGYKLHLGELMLRSKGNKGSFGHLMSFCHAKDNAPFNMQNFGAIPRRTGWVTGRINPGISVPVKDIPLLDGTPTLFKSLPNTGGHGKQ